MSQDDIKRDRLDMGKQHPGYHVRLPGFITRDVEIGLGDVIKRATASVGIQPCSGCAERAAKMNRWVIFTNRYSR
jgi:hypothetical protein